MHVRYCQFELPNGGGGASEVRICARDDCEQFPAKIPTSEGLTKRSAIRPASHAELVTLEGNTQQAAKAE